jgi:hypothetical protein
MGHDSGGSMMGKSCDSCGDHKRMGAKSESPRGPVADSIFLCSGYPSCGEFSLQIVAIDRWEQDATQRSNQTLIASAVSVALTDYVTRAFPRDFFRHKTALANSSYQPLLVSLKI